MTAQTRNTVLLCLLSGVVCGLLTASQCPALESACQVGAVADYESLAQWLHWVNWAPGLVYGALLAAANTRTTIVSRHRRIILYAAASAVIYLVAGSIFSPAAARASTEHDLGMLLAGGIVTGLIGAAGLAMAANLLNRSPISLKGREAGPARAAIVGAVSGLVFTMLGFYGGDNNLAFWPLAFVVWQVAVGLSISTGLQRSAPPV